MMDENPTSESSDPEEMFQNFEVIRRESGINCEYYDNVEQNPDKVFPCGTDHMLNSRSSPEDKLNEYYDGSNTSETSDENSQYSNQGPWLTENTVIEHGFIHVENFNRDRLISSRQKYLEDLNTRYFNKFNIIGNKSLLITEDIETEHNFIVYDGSTHTSVEESREVYTLTKKEEFCEHVSYSKFNIDVDDSDGSHYNEPYSVENYVESSQEIEEDEETEDEPSSETDDKSIQHSEEDFESFSEENSSKLSEAVDSEYGSFSETTNDDDADIMDPLKLAHQTELKLFPVPYIPRPDEYILDENEVVSVEDYFRVHVYNQSYVVHGQYGIDDNSNSDHQAQRKLRKLDEEAYAKLRKNLKVHKREYKKRLLINEVNKIHTRKSIDKNYKEEIKIIENDIRQKKINTKESLMAQLEEEKHLLKSERHLKLSDDPALVRLAAYYRKLRKRSSGSAIKEETPRSINLLLDEKDIEEDLKVIVESCQSESEDSTSSSSEDETSEE